MINVFDKNVTPEEFVSCGIMTINDIVLHAKVEHELNGSWFVNLTIIKDENEKYKKLEIEQVLKLHTPYGYQPFRIVTIEQSGLYTISVYARHIFFDLNKRYIPRYKIQDKSGTYVMANIKGAMDVNPQYFNLTSNIAANGSFDWHNKNVIDILLGDDENSFINKYGGELLIDEWDAQINTSIGVDNGYTLLYTKNITGFNCKRDTSALCTRIYPIGYDGISLHDYAGTGATMINNYGYVDSVNINNYATVYTQAIQFSDVKVKQNENDEEGFATLQEAQEELIRRAKKYFNDTECDRPKYEFDVSLVTLRDTDEYKDRAVLESLLLGDYVNIEIENISTKQRVISYTSNPLTHFVETLELGDEKLNLYKSSSTQSGGTVISGGTSGIVGSGGTSGGSSGGSSGSGDVITEDTIQDILDRAQELIDTSIKNGAKDSYVKLLPNAQTPAEIVIVDDENLEKAVNIVRLNKDGIGVSTTGYNGNYYGIVTNGKLVVNEATVTQINAALIKAGILQSANNATWINLDTGEFSFAGGKLTWIDNQFKVSLTDQGVATAEDIERIQNEVDDVKQTTDSLQQNFGNYTADGIIDEAEKNALKAQVELLRNEHEDIYASFQSLYDNSYLTEANKTKLYDTYYENGYKQAHDNLVNEINGVIHDIIELDKDKIDNLFTTHRTKLNSMRKALEAATEAIDQRRHDLGYNVGITTIDENGVSVTHTAINTATRMKADGFYIARVERDNNGNIINEEVMTWLSSTSAWSELKVDSVIAKDILNVYLGPTELYVNHDATTLDYEDGTQNRPFTSFASLTNLINGKIINKDLTIYIQPENNEINESLVIKNISGNCVIKIVYKKEAVHFCGLESNFCIDITNCTPTIWIDGQRTDYNATDGALLCDRNKELAGELNEGGTHGIHLDNVRRCEVNSLTINCRDWGILAIRTDLYTWHVDFGKCWNAVELQRQSIYYMSDDCGSNQEFVRIKSGSKAFWGSDNAGTRPKGTALASNGIYYSFGANRVETDSKRFANTGGSGNVVPTTQTHTKTFNCTGLQTYQYAWSNWSTDGSCKQGAWGYGLRGGHMFFNNTDISNFIGNGTVESATITLTRATNGGLSGQSNVYLNNSSCTSTSGTPSYSNQVHLGTLAWGETKTFTLPANMANELKNRSLAVYVNSTAQNNYINITACSVTIKVTK